MENEFPKAPEVPEVPQEENLEKPKDIYGEGEVETSQESGENTERSDINLAEEDAFKHEEEGQEVTDETSETVNQEKPKKKGFFSRFFGK